MAFITIDIVTNVVTAVDIVGESFVSIVDVVIVEPRLQCPAGVPSARA